MVGNLVESLNFDLDYGSISPTEPVKLWTVNAGEVSHGARYLVGPPVCLACESARCGRLPVTQDIDRFKSDTRRQFYAYTLEIIS